jgi:hypothetical protein
MVAFGWLGELGETCGILAPVKFAAVYDDTSNGCPVAANPLGCTVYNNIGSMFDRPEEVTTGTEGVVDLETVRQLTAFPLFGTRVQGAFSN